MPIDTEQIVRVVNVGDTTWENMAGARRYVIAPGEEEHMPLGHVCVWMGNIAENPPERVRAVELVKLKYLGPDLDGDWEIARPHLECYFKSGERIWFPADDPDGVMADYTPEAPTSTDKFTLNRIAELEAKLEALSAGGSNQRRKGGNTGADVEEDTPRQVPVSR